MASTSKIVGEEIFTELSLCTGVPFNISKSMNQKGKTPQEVHPLGILLELKVNGDPWKIKKPLTTSDCDHSSRLLLSKRSVEKYILPLLDENYANDCKTLQGREFDVLDLDTKSKHQLCLKTWSSTDAFVMTGNWRKEFVIRRGLKEGDQIGLWCDGTKFYFSLLKRKN